jgi:hypothetical protein
VFSKLCLWKNEKKSELYGLILMKNWKRGRHRASGYKKVYSFRNIASPEIALAMSAP